MSKKNRDAGNVPNPPPPPRHDTRVEEDLSRSDGRATNEDQVAALAYQIWVSRGEPEGTEQEDWFEAERRLRENPGEVRDDSELNAV